MKRDKAKETFKAIDSMLRYESSEEGYVNSLSLMAAKNDAISRLECAASFGCISWDTAERMADFFALQW